MEEFEKQADTQEIIKDADAETNEEKGKASPLSDILEMIESVVISVFIVLLAFTYIARPVTVEGRSMNPTLADKDKLVMRTLFYTPEAGDIVIVDNENSYTFKPGTEEITVGNGLNKRLIKRVIALGGQTIDIDFNTGSVTVDGKVLEEDYIADLTKDNNMAFDYPVTVPEGYIFVMGDNRNNSRDSRDCNIGFIREDDVLGKAIIRFYPFGDFKLLD